MFTPCGSAGKESACNLGDLGLIPGLGRSPREGKGCSLQYSGLDGVKFRPTECWCHICPPAGGPAKSSFPGPGGQVASMLLLGLESARTIRGFFWGQRGSALPKSGGSMVAAIKCPVGCPNQHWSWAMICDHFCDSSPFLC